MRTYIQELTHSAPAGNPTRPGLPRPFVLLRRPQVLAKLGICRSALHQWLDPDSPYHVPDMPQPIKLSERSRSSYWIEEEVDLFIQQRVAQARQVAAQGAQ
jgi:predicted DNA-binding transcriptional regulator AlpA